MASPSRAGTAMRHDGVSGWYARLDRVLDDRPEQIRIWLEAWENSLLRRKPVAAHLPEDWPTLPATLLTDPGNVLDHLLARHDADLDGRSPRGAHPTPSKLADSIIISEMLEIPADEEEEEDKTSALPLDALPPGFRQQIANLNLDRINGNKSEKTDEQVLEDIAKGIRTRSGISLPVADPATGGGLFAARIIKQHSIASKKWDDEVRLEDTRLLISNFQLADVSPLVIEVTKQRVFLEMVRNELATLDNKGSSGQLGRKEAEKLIDGVVREVDTLQGSWPFEEQPRLLFANPPWLRIKDRFRGHPEGSKLRKELGEALRSLRDNGVKRFSTMRGNVNLYRLFIERGLQILSPGGRLRIIVPDSLLREQSSSPLRQLLVSKHGWENIWFFDEGNALFSGISQGVVVISVISDGATDGLLMIGPMDRRDLRSEGKGFANDVPSLKLEIERWKRWTRGEWGVPRLPRKSILRQQLLRTVDELSHKPRLTEPLGLLTIEGEAVKVRVGEIDQTSHASHIKPWNGGGKGTPFIRGVHFTDDGEGTISLRHPAFEKGIPSRANERQQARWTGDIKSPPTPRLACQAIVNAHQQRRLRWVVMPSGCVLGNSVNHIELPPTVKDHLASEYGSLTNGLSWLCERLNDDKLDEWARAWAANNNVNNYELEMLPFDYPDNDDVVES